MDWWKLTPIIISVLAMFISAINFLYNYSRNKKNLDIELINYYNIPYSGTFVRINLINKSLNNITITKMCVNKYEVIRNKKIFFKYDTRLNSLDFDVFPIKLESYEAKELLLYFPELHFVKSTDITKDLYQIYSSRGKVKSKLVNKCKGENYTYLL
ncbi:hypothetical protein SE1UMMC_07280 [Staphylococcus epidermidis]|jgi:hypothetical protein|uniref:Uncharacterized protein n=12 Tax=root TaxID=1 RepID=A0A6M9X5T5_STAEP|nr:MULTISPECIES: hypothetical protein [Staphylococcus]MDU7271317.1 hypothetical protein [Staphylococcus lugdunensis]QPB07648.1 hypothetical protein PLKLOBMN_00077 [Staphylococcus phage PI-Sepi-HH2]DAO37871.1 MAG TPA: hypothetical protein [Caudoviricetes sp.]AUJ74201.1 hypothetical protein SE1UMMC_07280 [Staphylococcus epidermidis]EHQ75844.1 hypothetical protein SEVCU041_0242 [Staphylococcus epidermidis VCU041]